MNTSEKVPALPWGEAELTAGCLFISVKNQTAGGQCILQRAAQWLGDGGAERRPMGMRTLPQSSLPGLVLGLAFPNLG